MPETSSRGRRLARAALLLATATIISRFLGYLEIAMMSAQIGQNRFTDSFNVAFSVPDFTYNILVGGMLAAAFIPVFSGYLAKGEDDEAWYIASSLFNLIFLLLVAVIAAGMIFAPQFVHILAPGFDAASIALTARLMRIMFFQCLFLGLAGLMIGVLNSYNRFTGNALGIMLYNVPVVLVGIFFYCHPAFLNNQGRAISWYSIGVMAGAAVSLLVQSVELFKLDVRYQPVLDLRHPGVKLFGILVFPVLISQSVAYFNTFVTQNLASLLPSGELADSKWALRIMMIPMGLFATSIGVAILPTITEQAANGRWDDFRRSISLGLRTTNFLTFPAAAGLVAIGMPITRLFFQFGKFTSHDTALISYALFWYSFGIIGYSAEIMLTRAFYAIKDTITPMLVTFGMYALCVALSIMLVKPMGVGGLALAYSAAGVVELFALLVILRIRLGKIDGRRILTSGLGTIVASVALGVASYYTADELERLLGVSHKLSQLATVTGSMAVGILVYFGVASLLRMEEVQLTLEMLGRRFHIRRAEAETQ
jgi:putative peptidoglycan lipid II flippase